MMADGGIVIGAICDDIASFGARKCPLQNPEHCLQLLLPHGRSGSGTGIGRYARGGPSGNHEN